MSNLPRSFATLAQQARQETPPVVDVTPRVMQRIAVRVPATVSDWPLWSASGLSLAAALIMLLMCVQQDVFFGDPLADWLRPFLIVLK